MVHAYPAPSEIEQAIIDELNLARCKPREYAGYVHSKLARSEAYQGYEELFNVLRVRTPVQAVRIGRGLSAVARRRAEAVANGLQSHESSQDLVQRVAKFGKVDDPSSLREVVWVGRAGQDVRRIVLHMLADENSPTRSRRTALLSPSATITGISNAGNVVCAVLARNFVDNFVGEMAAGVYSRQHQLPNEPLQQMPIRQVMTPTHATRQQHSTAGVGSPRTPRLHEFDDIRKIMKSVHAKGGRASPVVPNGYPHHLPHSNSKYPERQPMPTPPPPPPARVENNTCSGMNSSNCTSMTPYEASYNGRIVGLNRIKTTLAEDNGESNYVGFNGTLRDRVKDWLSMVQVPVLSQ